VVVVVECVVDVLHGVGMWVMGTDSKGEMARGDEGAGRSTAQNGNPIWNALMMAVPES